MDCCWLAVSQRASTGSAVERVVPHVPDDRPATRVLREVGTLLDGRGGVIKNTRIVVEGTKIVRLDPKAKPVDFDLSRFTVLPGWIDSHVHITWRFAN